ncbi:MAG: 3-hydroxyacyl-ACP dehydratase FabZ family protein [Candidatus Rokuibacteriota bacterium]
MFVDRIARLEPPQRIETLKHVSGLEDVFADHFPGYPVLPGALVVEAFLQASELLIGVSHGFTEVGRLRRASRIAFRHQVRPGDRLAILCERRSGADRDGWLIEATASVQARRVAAATLEYTVQPAEPGTEAGRHAERLRALARELLGAPVEITRGEGE